jgi:zinc protease
MAVLLEQYRTILSQNAEYPLSYYRDEVKKIATGNNPYLVSITAADLDRVSRDDVLAFARRIFNPADYVFTFVGNIDIAAIRDYAETYLAAIPSDGERFNEWTQISISRPGRLEQNIYKGKEEQSYVYMTYFHDELFSDALSATSEALSGYLNIILLREIREKLGGVYSISPTVLMQAPPHNELAMQVLFVCDPNRVAELSAAVKVQLERVANGDIDVTSFNNTVEAMKKTYEVNLQDNSYIARSYSNSAVILHSPLSRLNQTPSYYDALTPADIQAMVARLLSNGPAEIVLYPENRK